jgi:glutaconyl-CoA decarboxylase
MNEYSMPRYFQNMEAIGESLFAVDPENTQTLKNAEQAVAERIQEILENGKATADLNSAGQLCAMQRIHELIDEGTWLPLNSLFNPQNNANGSTNIVKGLAKVSGKWVVIVASDNKKMAGAWVPGQAENLLRASDTAKRLRIPLVYLLNCSGVKMDEQEKVYPDRRGGGTPFYRNAQLNQLGVPVIVGIYGTNPAGGGYHSISPTILIAHEKANMAVGGAGIVGGMSPKGHVDLESAQALIEAQKELRQDVPGTAAIHHDETGFMREVYGTEEEVLAAIRKYIGYTPAFNPEFFRVDTPSAPAFPAEDLYSLFPANHKRPYDIYDVIARLTDGSQFMEYKKGYGPEIVTGLAKFDGMLVGVVANVQGFFLDYPEYREDALGVGGKLYRQGLIKMSEFVTLCTRDHLPMVWLQDTTGIDVGNEAERAELLGLGQSLIYSIQNSDLPMLEITMRKGTAAAHYVLGGPQGNDTNAFSLGTAATEIYVMHGETAAAAMYARRLVKDDAAGKDLQPTIDRMNQLITDYANKSRAEYCAKAGLVDELVSLDKLRDYLRAFTAAAYQNPKGICPHHQMVLPRIIADYNRQASAPAEE